MYSALNDDKQNMFSIHEFQRFYPNIINNAEITIGYKETFNAEDDVSYDDISSSSNFGEGEYFEESENDMENFDPSLFCPDIIMELGENPIVINTDELSNVDGAREESSPGDKTSDGFLDLTSEENQLGKKTYGTGNPVQYTRIHCTACNDHLGSALCEMSNRLVHPLLKVLICKECNDFYTSGEFEKDYDGSETYCRWCGQGGLVICCSNCEFVFCTKMKRKYSDDHDYDPDTEQLSRPSSSSSIKSVSSICNEVNTSILRKPLTTVSIPNNLTKTSEIITQKCQNITTISAANPTIRPKMTFVSQPKPILKLVNPSVTASDINGRPMDPNQKRMLPNGERLTIITPRNFVSSSAVPGQTPNQKTVNQQNGNIDQQRKRTCYEKAVSAATSITSDLSCNLINLRQNKLTAKKLDDFVAVHNKGMAYTHPSQQQLASKQFLGIPDPVSTTFKFTPSQYFGYLTNNEEKTIVGIKEKKIMRRR
ncbi:hypothetical protein NQ314_018287 [Rhamnusium bicolor]|uniref:PHD-type domain-containing protein n=1 Tax=Rhamnusium bicolor TaxID=1586634 RepID=A0AAV8WS42_9CUCU|nr:hypothetical protein NQ314_018287 [Rhamnusium bicolor]